MRLKKNSEGFRGNQYTENDESGESGLGQNDPNHISERTSARIAKEIGTGERYVRRAEEFAKGLDAAEEVSPGIKQEVFSGTLKATDSDVAAIARASPDDRLELVENLRKPRAAARGQPVKEAADPDLEDDDEEADEDIEEETESYRRLIVQACQNFTLAKTHYFCVIFYEFINLGDVRSRPDKGFRYFLLRIGENIKDASCFRHNAVLHDRHFVANRFNYSHFMSNDHNCQAKFFVEFFDKLQN